MPGPPAAAWFSIACMACAAAALARGRSCTLALALGVVSFGAGWFALDVRQRAGSNADVLLASERPPGEPRIVEVEGIVLDSPREIRSSGQMRNFLHIERREVFTLSLRAVRTSEGDWAPAAGRARVITHPGEHARAGQRVRLMGVHRPIRPAMNPGAPDGVLWAAQERDAGTIGAQGGGMIRPRAHEDVRARAHGAIVGASAWARSRALGVLGSDAGEGGALLRAVVLGEHDPEHRELRDAFARTGLAHLLAISGFHLALLVGMVLLALRLTGDHGRWEFAVVAMLVLAYLVLVPASAPIVRAGVFILALVLSESLGRRYDRLSVLGWVGVILILWRAMDVHTLGFQLSVGLTAALLWVAPRVEAGLRPRTIRGLLPSAGGRGQIASAWMFAASRVRSAFAISLVCWLIAIPVVMHHVGLVSPWAILTTLIVTPLIVLVLALGFAGVLAGLLAPGVGVMIADGGTLVASWTGSFVAFIDRLPASSIRIGAVSPAWAIAGVVLAVLWLRHARTRWRWLASATAALSIWLGVERIALRDDAPLRIDTLSVGDGTCHLLRSAGEAMLWDCGSSSPSFGVRDLPRAIHALGLRSVPTILITHPNLDHFSALPDVLRALGVERLIVNEAFMTEVERQPRGAEAFAMARLRDAGVEVSTISRGGTITLGEATIDVLWPPGGFRFEGNGTINDTSIVALARVPTRAGERRALLTGDIQRHAMERIMELEFPARSGGATSVAGASPTAGEGPDTRIDVMELPHHGSHHATAERFVERLDPSLVIQSTGPSRLRDERWERARDGRAWLVTARDGAVGVRFARDGSIRAQTTLTDRAVGVRDRLTD